MPGLGEGMRIRNILKEWEKRVYNVASIMGYDQCLVLRKVQAWLRPCCHHLEILTNFEQGAHIFILHQVPRIL